MCGRTAVSLGADRIRRACVYRDNEGRRRHPEWKNADRYSPSYNKSPQSNSPVLLSRKHFEKDVSSSERILVAMRWGLIPSWFKEDDPSKMQYNTSNCRSDSMMEKLSYKGPLLKGQRCVVLADGYYEWQQQNGQKQPYFIYFPQPPEEMFSKPDVKDDDTESESRRLLTMAGIFDCWKPLYGGEALYSYTIITVDAAKGVSSIHHRMPAILDGDEAIRKWLDFAEVPTQEALKLIHPTENLAFHPVSTIVNNSRNNTPECINPIELDLKKDVKVSASSKMMLNWLKNKSPKKEDDGDNDGLPRWSSQFIQAGPPKRTSKSLMDQWLKKEDGEPSAKQSRKQ
ncbi:abasic site processing protein HMCES [Pogona vitticeps]|uniref:Abasic site processing protein HMCES n=1 Tax=Pogona vitticeps TaxID=103695 RepID=A0A6J0TZF5_9SAUR|nr:embryonic stem cell-specific 5-hydroxymethylcytosine-binding protein [Pogona vitticeps]XP_020653747.1 embryonic stem cell-specific 5-hydroxymethylcytosine-binding protein [Pogona vitticeps]XP_020653748.1 embryonic stem cell-specific 5-hydroxymethylcytosine-binding protein [Pogona vitticeps]XP_020653749.1 embryonic stem cell-specific 5-hydroxymethylcytosine-binding protein [Pogona vitticeps]XP_020653750.1 embryonic stem cell-specific 5-hydroxymethylcytosine-binding protein [Pogona vitticeps]